MSRSRSGAPPAPVAMTCSSNCSGEAQPALRLQVHLEGAGSVGPRRLADGAGGDLGIGPAQRLHHVARRQAARRHPVGIQPDPHGIVARAEDLRVADALQPRQPVLDRQGGEVGDVLLAAAAVGRDQVHDHQQVGRGLLHGDAEPPHLLGQPRLGDGDAVLHQHLRLVDVGALLERPR